MATPWRAQVESPLGLLRASGSDAVSELVFVDASEASADLPTLLDVGASCAELLSAELAAYFEGQLQEFTVPLRPSGTEFQLEVWRLLRQIRYGETRTYGDLARQLGDTKKSRAVGLANGANPIAILIPCHRVIGSNGDLTGYAGGMRRKVALLELESRQQTLF